MIRHRIRSIITNTTGNDTHRDNTTLATADSINLSEDDILLTICGMHAIFTAYRLIRSTVESYYTTLNTNAARDCTNDRDDKSILSIQDTQVVVFGFPYLDTLKVRSIIYNT